VRAFLLLSACQWSAETIIYYRISTYINLLWFNARRQKLHLAQSNFYTQGSTDVF
jgi:hypothetical protein